MRRALESVLLFAYPEVLRAEHGAEMLLAVQELRVRREYRGVLGAVRFCAFLCSDVIRTLARERLAELRTRVTPPARAPADSPPYLEAVAAALGVLALYVATLAPTVAFWDAGEYMTAAHVLGIPHPPGNPLFVMAAHVWERMLLVLGVNAAVALNLFSAGMSAAAHGFVYLLSWRALRSITTDVRVQRAGAVAAVLLSATAFTVWNQSNVSEKVYTVSLFTVALCAWLVVRWRDAGRAPWYLVAVVFVLALTSTNHLMGVLAAPAVLAFVLLVEWRALLNRRLWPAFLLAATVGLLPQFFLPIRAAQRPVLAETEPTCDSVTGAVASVYTWGKYGCDALSLTLTREQYDKPSIALDPTVYPEQRAPRQAGLLTSQVTNYLQYFDWQWARSLGGRDPVFGGARPLLTALFLMLGLLGAGAQWRRDRAGAVLLGTLFLTFSLGLVAYLNFKYGYSLARERFPDPASHEVRERDYFFLIGFSLWGVWSGIGLAVLWQRLQSFASARIRMPALATAPLLAVALVPLALNWSWATRAEDYTARDWAYNVLMSVEPYGVLFTNGDNDTFPLWYIQEVEGVRRDVTVLVTSYLNTSWYARQARDVTEPCRDGRSAAQSPARIVCQRTFEAGQVPVELARLMPAANPPEDTILPLSDAEIGRMAGVAFVTPEPLTFRAGGVVSTIPAGTVMQPADTFVAAIVRASIGKRTIHFSTPSPVMEKLGLGGHAVRHGLTLRLAETPVRPSSRRHIVPIDARESSSLGASYVDLPFTETLLDVAVRRGRILDPDAPFADHTVSNIILQYAWAHIGAAQAHAALGNESGMSEHVRRAEAWQRIIDE